jgi:hypothetical protein
MAGREQGFCKRIAGDEREQENISLMLDDGLMDNDVFEVERVVERRRRKGRNECLVLWKGYRREESMWVNETDVTAAALKTFTEPNPPERAILDAASDLCRAIYRSLCLGLIRNNSFNVCFRRDVFKCLFSNCGTSVRGKSGKMYARCDFNDKYFCTSDFMFVNKFNECICVEFPVYMYSYVKCIKRDNNCYDFCENVRVCLKETILKVKQSKLTNGCIGRDGL